MVSQMARAKILGEPFMAHLKNLYNIPCIVNFVMDASFKSSRPLTIFSFGFTNIFSMCSLYTSFVVHVISLRDRSMRVISF